MGVDNSSEVPGSSPTDQQKKLQVFYKYLPNWHVKANELLDAVFNGGSRKKQTELVKGNLEKALSAVQKAAVTPSLKLELHDLLTVSAKDGIDTDLDPRFQILGMGNSVSLGIFDPDKENRAAIEEEFYWNKAKRLENLRFEATEAMELRDKKRLEESLSSKEQLERQLARRRNEYKQLYGRDISQKAK